MIIVMIIEGAIQNENDHMYYSVRDVSVSVNYFSAAG
jgi:hypothetical protein